MEQRLGPRVGMPLAGRERELRELAELLARPDCRWVTLAGPGGVGKTRLAAAFAAEQREAFADGAYVIRLQAVETQEQVLPALAEGLGLALTGAEPAETQVANFLHDRTALLVLDNFEQLAATGAAGLLAGLLADAPGVKVMVTSRAVLHLTDEWVYPLAGLSYPAGPVAAAEALSYGAVELFAACARRRRRDFDVAAEITGVVRVCQLVEGLPLALELAAAWVNVLPAAEIAAALAHNLDLLSDASGERPARQASWQATFEYSWGLLAEAERAVFRQLAVFQGGFGREAAETVADGTLPLLAALADKSLVTRDANGRYHLHELLRQAGEAALAAEGAAAVAATRARHMRYYAGFHAERLAGLHGPQQRETLTELAAELDNLRTAWAYAVATADADALGQMADSAYYVWQMQSRYVEGVAALGAAIEELSEAGNKALLARLLDYQGWLYVRLGQAEAARVALTRSQALFAAGGDHFPATFGGDPRTALGVLALVGGDFVAAAQLGQAAHTAAVVREDAWNTMFARYVQANAAVAAGDEPVARAYAEEAHGIAAAAGEQWFRAFLLNDLGRIVLAQGEAELARDYFQASYALREAFHDPGGMAVALNHLGEVALRMGRPALAQTQFEHSLALYANLGDRGGLAAARHGLGRAALAEGRLAEAQTQLREVLRLAVEIQYVPLVLAAVTSAAGWLLTSAPAASAVTWLTVAQQHPAAERAERARAGEWLALAATKLAPERMAAATERAIGLTLEAVAAAALARLAAEGAPTEAELAATDTADALTPRELQVLHLMAAGHSNKAIAAALKLGVGTVKWYTGQINAKLQTRSRTQAILQARARGLLP